MKLSLLDFLQDILDATLLRLKVLLRELTLRLLMRIARKLWLW